MADVSPPSASTRERVVLVDGDVTIDWQLARRPFFGSPSTSWNTEDSVRTYPEAGGALLLRRLIAAVTSTFAGIGGPTVQVYPPAPPAGPFRPNDPGFNHSFATWSLHPYSTDEKLKDADPSWRVDRFLGFDRGDETGATPRVALPDGVRADVVVLDDAGLGFRTASDRWPAVLQEADAASSWIVVKMSRPVAEGLLWEHLVRDHPSRLIVVTTANDLRFSEVRISRDLSWERAAEDLARELATNPRIRSLSRCAATIVSFGPVGAFLLRGTAGVPSARTTRELYFDPGAVEGAWGTRHPGAMIGYMSCLTAGIVRELVLRPDAPDFGRAIRSGLGAMRELHVEGYGARGATAEEADLEFPATHVAKALARDCKTFFESPVPEPLDRSAQPGTPDPAGTEQQAAGSPWTILRTKYEADQNLDDNQYAALLEAVARRIVWDGHKEALRGVPVGEFGALVTADRHEIESFSSIRSLIGEYWKSASKSRPLCIAVFGAPGSGKSFGIEQVAVSVLPGTVKKLTFNLSQFSSPDGLIDAFHQVRDIGLAGQLPLVFWDEFDTSLGTPGTPLGWLRYFLAPMQDGQFQQGQLTHPIGPAVFVFAGSTCTTMEAFVKRVTPREPDAAPGSTAATSDGANGRQTDQQPGGPGSTVDRDGTPSRDDVSDQADAEDQRSVRDAKGTDFVSRLKGFVNVIGPNPVGQDPVADPHFIIRRALLLRSSLSRGQPHLFSEPNGKGRVEIDSGVLRALLRTTDYRHGARSMESILAMSLLSGQRQFERSSLRPQVQLDLHVCARDFMALVHALDPWDERLEELAETFHVAYCVDLLEKGHPWEGQDEAYLDRFPVLREARARAVPLIPEEAAVYRPALVPYQELPEERKDDNRAFVRHIAKKLELANYVIVPARKDQPPFDISGDLDMLAEVEHDRWMSVRLDTGWRYGEPRDNRSRHHPLLLPWNAMSSEELVRRYGRRGAERIGNKALSEADKLTDRNMVAAIPRSLALIGFTAVKLPGYDSSG